MNPLRAEYFPKLQSKAYLNHAAVSPLNCRAETAMTEFLGLVAKSGVLSWGRGNEARIRLREKLGRLIGTEAAHIGLVGNTSYGLCLVANEYPWQRGDHLVLIRGEFPGNIVPWLTAAKNFDLRIIWLDLEDVTTGSQAFLDAMALKPRLMAISWVQYQTGRVVSLADLSEIRRKYQVEICLDAIQGLGPLCMDLRKTPLDYVATGGHKWLLSPEGVGFVYIHPDRLQALKPAMVSWISQQDAASFLFNGAGFVDYEQPLKPETYRYEMATMNSSGFVAMEASIDIFLELGAEAVHQRVHNNARRCSEGLENLGLSPAHGGDHAGIVSVALPNDTLVRYAEAFKNSDVSVATPDGHLRAAPHFYNDHQEIDFFLETFARLLKGKFP